MAQSIETALPDDGSADGGVGEVVGGVAGEVIEGAGSNTGGNSLDNIIIPGPNLTQNTAVFQKWLERVGNYSPWNDVFSVQQQETSLIIDVPFENRYLFLAYCLGFSYVDTQHRLRRINPIPHPYWTWMRVARVGHQGVRFTGTKVVNGIGKGVARYNLARFNISFANYPWQFYEDSEDTNLDNLAERELDRNTFWEAVPTSQFLAAEGGAAVLKFAYNASGAGAGALPGVTGGPKGGRADTGANPPERVEGRVSFRAPFGTPVNQINYRLHWKWVPYDYIHFGRIPVHIYKLQGKINDNFVKQFPRGTLLFDPPEITTYVAPLRFKGQSILMCDVVFNLRYFDPPRGITVGAGSDVRGHNLIPWRENNLWYPAVRRNKDNNIDDPPDTDNKGLFAYADFMTAFKRPLNAD